jgi:hypothetical protein
MLTNLVRTVSSLFCAHEWARRRQTGRVYLECVRCLATTPGVQYGPAVEPAAPALRKALEVVEA